MDPHHHRHIDGVSGPSEKLTSEQSAQLDAGLDDFLSFLDEPTPKPVSENGNKGDSQDVVGENTL